MNAVDADLQVRCSASLLPCQAPVRRYTANVIGTALSRCRLSIAYVIGAVKGSGEIKMLVPHGIGAQSRHILRQKSIDNRCRCGGRSRVRGDERKTPTRSAVPEIFDSRVVVQSNSVVPLF